MAARVARAIVIGLVLALAGMPTAPANAAAKAVLLKRAGSNLMGAPVDAVLTPYTFPETFVRGFYLNKHYSALEKVLLTPVWTAVYLPTCGFVSTAMPAARLLEGVVMLPVGVATSGSDYDWGVFQPLPGKRNAVVQKPPFYMGTRWCKGFFE
jgi:hypothetical protein